MRIYRVKKTFEIAYAHRLFNYNGKCENLHGHNGIIEIIIESNKLDDQSMVMDFTEIKSKAARWIYENLDHATLLFKKDPLVKILKKQKLFLFDENPTAEIIALTIKEGLKKEGLNPRIVRFWENSTSMAEVEEKEEK